MSRSLLHDWECAIDRCCRDDNPKEMISIAEDIYNTAYVRGKNHSDVTEVLDKIRAEIKEWYWQADKQALAKDPCVVDAMIDLFIRTIDKYKAESEPQESEVEDGNDD